MLWVSSGVLEEWHQNLVRFVRVEVLGLVGLHPVLRLRVIFGVDRVFHHHGPWLCVLVQYLALVRAMIVVEEVVRL